MKNSHTENTKIIKLNVEGMLQVERIFEFEETINSIARNSGTHLLMDLSDLQYLKSKDLRVILRAVKKIQSRRGKVVICCLRGYVREMFTISRFQETVKIADSIESGLKTLGEEMEAA